MPVPVVLVGAKIQLYINNVVYKQVESLTFTVDTDVEEIMGIDSLFAQELTPSKVKVFGSVQGLRLMNNGGLQGAAIRPLYLDFAASPYISIRVVDRQTQEEIFACFDAMVTSENHTIPNRGSYKLNFSFKGKVPVFALDRDQWSP